MALQMVSQRSPSTDHFGLLPFISLMMTVLATVLFISSAIASINLGAGVAEGWIPVKGDEQLSKVPVLVEWDGETIYIHRENGHQEIALGKEPRRWWNSDWEFRNRDMRDFIVEMTNKKTSHYVLFAVRPTGFKTLQTVASEFRTNGVSIGYEPIEQGKAVRLRLEEASQ